MTGNSETRFGDIKAVSFKEKNQANPIKCTNKAPVASAVAGSTCTFCGKNNHVNADCRTRSSEFTNNQNRPLNGYEAHGRLIQAVGAREWIPNFKELQALMGKAGYPSGPSLSAVEPIKPSKNWKSKGRRKYYSLLEDVSTILQIKLHNATSPHLLPVVLTFSSQEEAKGSINVDVLLATGCLAGDFVARQIVDKYDIKPVLQSSIGASAV